MKSTKAELTMEIVVMSLVALLALLFLVNYMFKGFNVGSSATKCETFGGTLIQQTCDVDVSTHLNFVDGKNKDKSTQYCCKKRAGIEKKEYETWLNSPKITKVVGSTSTKGTVSVGNSDATKIKTVPLSELEAGKSEITFQGEIYNKEPYERAIDKPFNIQAVHNIKKGTYCYIYIVKARSANAHWEAIPDEKTKKIISIEGSRVESKNCAPTKDGLIALELPSFSLKKTGFYKADFIVKDKIGGSILDSKTVVFKITPSEKIPESNFENSKPPTIELRAPITSYREQKNYCTLSATIKNNQNTALDDFKIYYGKATLGTKKCSDAIWNDVKTLKPTKVTSDKISCFKLIQPYVIEKEDGTKTPATKEKLLKITPKECDFISYNIPISEEKCTACSDLDKTNCASTKKSGVCKFEFDCYTRNRFPLKDTCESCTDNKIKNCEDYNEESACLDNNCIPKKCQWKKGVRLHRCIPA